MAQSSEAKEKQELATRLLSEHGGYDWLLEGKAFWSVSEVVHALAEQGVKISNDTVAKWFKTLTHTQDFGGPVGLRASRNDLIMMFAIQMISHVTDDSDNGPDDELPLRRSGRTQAE